MSEQPRPVRAWADYDEWSVFLNSMPMAGPWFVAVPKGAKDHAIVDMLSEMGRDAIRWLTTPEPVIFHPGPLRSIRILLSTGHAVELVRKADSVTIAQGQRAVMLEPGCMKFSLFSGDGAWLHGGWYMPEVADSDAVTRALAEAVAWIEGENGGASGV